MLQSKCLTIKAKHGTPLFILFWLLCWFSSSCRFMPFHIHYTAYQTSTIAFSMTLVFIYEYETLINNAAMATTMAMMMVTFLLLLYVLCRDQHEHFIEYICSSTARMIICGRLICYWRLTRHLFLWTWCRFQRIQENHKRKFKWKNH